MPIYEFACPKCRVVFSFLARTLKPEKRSPTCPRCGNKNLEKQMSSFSTLKGLSEPSQGGDGDQAGGPDMDDPKVERVMREMERDLEHLDENNPKHMAYMMRKMKDIMPGDAMPKEIDVAIKRLESGEDPEKIEADMGDVFGDMMGGPGEEGGGGGGYSKDGGLYEY